MAYCFSFGRAGPSAILPQLYFRQRWDGRESGILSFTAARVCGGFEDGSALRGLVICRCPMTSVAGSDNDVGFLAPATADLGTAICMPRCPTLVAQVSARCCRPVDGPFDRGPSAGDILCLRDLRVIGLTADLCRSTCQSTHRSTTINQMDGQRGVRRSSLRLETMGGIPPVFPEKAGIHYQEINGPLRAQG